MAERVIRTTARLATQLNTEWHAIYVETPQLQRLPAVRRERILRTLKLAQDLGAMTAVLSGGDVAREIVNYAYSHNFSRLVVGRQHKHWFWHKSLLQRLARHAPELDILETGRAGEREEPPVPPTTDTVEDGLAPGNGKKRHWRYVWAVGAVILTALLATPMLEHFDLLNILMLFLLTELLVATKFGRGPAALAAFLSVAAFDFFFVQPRFTFSVSDLQYLVVFAVMLAVGLISGQLTAGLRYQSKVASIREGRARALYEFSRALSSALQAEQIFEITRNFVQRTFRAKALILLPDNDGRLQLPSGAESLYLDVLDLGIAQWAFDRAIPAGMGTDTLPGNTHFYLPLVAPMRTRGVLVIRPEHRRWILIPEQRQQLDTFAALTAIALERVHYIDVAQDALVRMESERLRNSLLAALSHDLRTPLTSLIGLAESLTRARPPLPESQQAMARSLHEEMLRMSKLVTNLLDMARIQSGEVKLNLEWQHVEEVVGSALRASRSQLTRHHIEPKLPHDLPLVRFDAVLLERVLCNLIENAVKYTPPDSRIVIAAEAKPPSLEVSVYDNGPGLPRNREEAVFEKFTRGECESATPGVGLGLAICRAIVEAHGGTIRAGHSPEGGACIVFTLPLGTPPAVPEIDENSFSTAQRTS
jgi:two-component system sensor histidine kinase KdpD